MKQNVRVEITNVKMPFLGYGQERALSRFQRKHLDRLTLTPPRKIEKTYQQLSPNCSLGPPAMTATDVGMLPSRISGQRYGTRLDFTVWWDNALQALFILESTP